MDDQELERQRLREAIKEQVLKELKEARKEGSMVSYLNNLRFNLNRALWSEYRDDHIITNLKTTGKWSRPKKDFPIERPEQRSERWQNESHEETLRSFREMLKNLGINEEALNEASMPSINEIMQMSDEEVTNKQAEIEAFYETTLVPIYIKLRQMGYSYLDLIQ